MLNHQNNNETKIYNYDEKKKLVYRIQDIKSKKIYFKLYNLINNENVKFTKNNNGIFFNINKLSNQSLKVIEYFLDENDLQKELINDSEISNNDSDSLVLINKFKTNKLKKKNLD